jgi:hypothetical protein
VPTAETVRGPTEVAGLGPTLGADAEAVTAATAPNWHYTHISDDVLPALRAAGVPDAQIEQMPAGNPRRYFSGGTS